MKTITKILVGATIVLSSVGMSYAQDKDETKKEEVKKKPKIVRSPFQSSVLFEHQTIINPRANTLVLNMQHRFGKLWSGNGFDLLGLYATANIRLGFEYAILDQLQIGFGTTKGKLVQDFNIKWSILQQRKTGMPIFLTVYSDMGIEAGKKDYAKFGHRMSYYHEIMIARKFHKRFTLQVSASYSHFNIVDNTAAFTYNEGSPSEYIVNHDAKHDNFSVGALARIKCTPQTSVVIGYDQTVTPAQQDYEMNYPFNLSVGVEIATSAHSFQIFVGNRNGLLGQYNMAQNRMDITKGDFLLGFNITRLWGL